MRFVLMVTFGMVLASCSSSVKQVRLSIRPAADMNDSRSCYVVARAVDEKAFNTESYDDVAAKVMTPDESVQSSVAVVPGVTQEITLTLPEKGRLAIYAMLRQPEDETWRLLLPATLPEKVELQVKRGRLCFAGEGSEGLAPRCSRR